jgi:uncharacterized protein (DUF1330 family)
MGVKGYLVANIDVIDPERYAVYRAAAPAVVAAFGGRYLIRGPAIETVEGDLALTDRFVVIEFDSLDQARAFYASPAYQAIALHRQAGTHSAILLMEGCVDPATSVR